jgi:hypothetical protein
MILLVVSHDGWSSVDVGGGKGRGRNGIAGPEELTGKGRGRWRGRGRRIEVEQRRRAREEQRLREGFCSQTVPHVGAIERCDEGMLDETERPSGGIRNTVLLITNHFFTYYNDIRG